MGKLGEVETVVPRRTQYRMRSSQMQSNRGGSGREVLLQWLGERQLMAVGIVQVEIAFTPCCILWIWWIESL